MLLLKKSYKHAHDAILFEQNGEIAQALDNWNNISPQAYPAQVDMLVGKARSAGIKGVDALKMMMKNKIAPYPKCRKNKTPTFIFFSVLHESGSSASITKTGLKQCFHIRSQTATAGTQERHIFPRSISGK